MPRLVACRYYDPPGLWCQYCRNGAPQRCIDTRVFADPPWFADQTREIPRIDRVTGEPKESPLPMLGSWVAMFLWGVALTLLFTGSWPLLCVPVLLIAALVTVYALLGYRARERDESSEVAG